uniref:Uncharacterized protein n=1 Tax=Ascaris lumbricoides TaxID=6252 RepID=A0A0M3I5A4_ASCLU
MASDAVFPAYTLDISVAFRMLFACCRIPAEAWTTTQCGAFRDL